LPRYCQRIAIDRINDSKAKGQDRQQLVMATGTGMTYTADICRYIADIFNVMHVSFRRYVVYSKHNSLCEQLLS
jgi:predicted helicase